MDECYCYQESEIIQMKISIIIPAHNEEKRIGKMLRTYHSFFSGAHTERELLVEFVVVLNGCTDNTLRIVTEIAHDSDTIFIIDLPQAGKGLAIRTGFQDAFTRPNDLIGFVDADMATSPPYFDDLVANIDDYDGIIASRYMPGAHVDPPRPGIKRWGSRLIYEPLIWLLFGLRYYDLQCGAKLFKRKVIEKIIPKLAANQWEVDIELLYLCKKNNFAIKEIPTVWYDQAGSKLRPLRSGLHMLGSIIALRLRYSWLAKLFVFLLIYFS